MKIYAAFIQAKRNGIHKILPAPGDHAGLHAPSKISPSARQIDTSHVASRSANYKPDTPLDE